MSEINVTNLKLRRETWQDSSGQVFLETIWQGKPGSDLENLFGIRVVGVSDGSYQMAHPNTRLFHKQAQAYYDSLIRLARRTE